MNGAGRSRRYAILIATLTGCGYASQYTPPVDGRARPLWIEDHLTNNFGQLAMPPGCTEALYWTAHPERGPRAVHAAERGPYWVPVYYGPDVVVVTPGVAPVSPHPVLFAPSRRLAQAAPLGAATGTSGGGEDSWREALRILEVIAMFVLLPVLDVALAVEQPEASRFSAEAIDEINAYNDLARRAGTPCSYGAP